MSVRSPPVPMWKTSLLPLKAIVCPFRSSVTAFVTVSIASPSAAVTSFVSVTVPPSSNCACSASHGVPVVDLVEAYAEWHKMKAATAIIAAAVKRKIFVFIRCSCEG